MNKWIRYLLIVFEVGGGFAGITVTIMTIQLGESMPADIWVLYLFVIFLFLFGIIAGLALLEKPKLGIAMSAFYQALQIPILSSPIISCQFNSGLQLGVGWLGSRPAFIFEFGARSTFFLFRDSDPWLVGINLVALALFMYLYVQLLPKAGSNVPGEEKRPDGLC